MSIRIISTLYPVTLQDAGRIGFRSFGVPLSGPMDPLSHRLANLLCGNDAPAVSLEITLHGLILLFEEDALIALCGGGSIAMMNGKPLGSSRPLHIRQGSLVEFKPSSTGCRMYLAISGGIKGDVMMGSAATYVPASIGGFEGRALRKGDLLMLKGPPGMLSSRILSSMFTRDSDRSSLTWGSHPFPELLDKEIVLRYLPGPEWGGFTSLSLEQFQTESFQITDRADRMGYQLQGPALQYRSSTEMLTSGVCPGTVQVTHAGVPVILMSDGQTTGGYPRVAQIITADMALCGQLRPGSNVRFSQVSMTEALAMHRNQQEQLDRVEQSILIRFGL